MRIELGGAFADLLNEQGKGSGDNEMGYVERTLGFRTRDVDDRDLRLVFPLTYLLHLSFKSNLVTERLRGFVGYTNCWGHHALEKIPRSFDSFTLS